MGTVSYAAPEQLAGEELDARADQYALAASIFHLLAGVPPFDKSNPVAVISAHLNAPPPQISRLRPELARLDEVFSTALAKDPAQRFGSCREFAAALTGHASAEGEFGAAKTQQAMPTASRGGVSEGGRNRLVGKTSAIAAVAVVAVVAAGVVGYTMTRDSSHTPVPGERPGSLNQPANQGQLEGTQATARSAAEALKASIPEITKIVDVDEDNDPNEGMMGGRTATSLRVWSMTRGWRALSLAWNAGPRLSNGQIRLRPNVVPLTSRQSDKGDPGSGVEHNQRPTVVAGCR